MFLKYLNANINFLGHNPDPEYNYRYSQKCLKSVKDIRQLTYGTKSPTFGLTGLTNEGLTGRPYTLICEGCNPAFKALFATSADGQ